MNDIATDFVDDVLPEIDWRKKVYRKVRIRKIPIKISTNVRERDHNHCQVNVCRSKTELACHHIIPRNEGGPNTEDNLILLCEKCHNEIEDLTTQLRSTIDIRNYIPLWYAEQRPHLSAALDGPPAVDWHTWVYGGARNPNK